jgi:hypothetical protein
MNRRQFVTSAGWASLAVGVPSGFLFLRRGQLRAEARGRLLDEALPPLDQLSTTHLTRMPQRAREEIRRFFHGKCLNVESFATHVCSSSFVEQVGRCRTNEEREACFLAAFCSRVATEVEILNYVDTIAGEMGAELNAAWQTYCERLTDAWKPQLAALGSPALSSDQILNATGSFIRGEIQATIQSANANRLPSLGESLENVGKTALLLAPLAFAGEAGLAIGLPLFIVQGIRSLWDYIWSRWDDRRADFQAAISGRLAMLGNRIGDGFQQEMRLRLNDLHTWRTNAVRKQADNIVEARIGLFESI